MLQKLNERIQGAVAWIIVVLVTVTFTLFGLDYYLQSHRSADVKVKINGHDITKEAYELNYRRLSQSQAQDALTAEQEHELKQQVLSEMMVNLVSVDAAHAHGFEVDGRQASAAILQIPQFQEDGHFSSSRYAQALNNAFFTPQTFQQEVRQGMLLNQQRFALIGTEFILPNELNHYVALSMQTRDYHYAIIKAADFINRIKITPEEEKQYYQKNQKQFLTQEQVSLEYVRLSLQSIKNKITISDDQIARYYEDNKNNYLTPAQWQLTYVRFALKESASTSQEEHAKQAAQNFYDATSKSGKIFSKLSKVELNTYHAQLGTLPVVIAGQSNLDQYLINLTEEGQISTPIRTKHGYDVLQVKSYKTAAIQPLAEVKHLIHEQLRQEAAQEQYAALEERLSDLSYQNPDSLAPVAAHLGVPLEHTGLFSKNHPAQEPITQAPAIKQAAFSQDVLTYGNNSEPIQLDADTLVVLRVKQHIPATLQDISQVKNVIDSVLSAQKSSFAAQEYGQTLLKTQLGSTPKSLRWKTAIAVQRDSEVNDTQLSEIAFSIGEVGQYKGASLQNGDFAIVKLTKITDGQADLEDKDQVRNLTQQLEASFGLMDYDLYISQLMAQAKIVRK